ncbi:MAG: DNA primase, partial [Candidatus Parabeggiatoa sp. nov. 3]
MSIFLDCPYSEKDEAKKLGAKFDWAEKKWFIPPGLET